MQDKSENIGIRLLDKGRKGIFRLIFSRAGLVLLLLALNFGLLFAAFSWVSDRMLQVYGLTAIFVVGMLLYLINSPLDPSAKLTWLILVMLMPVFGSLLYFYSLGDWGHRAMSRRWRQRTEDTRDAVAQDADTLAAFAQADRGSAALAGYLAHTGCYPAFEKSSVRYFSSGEEKYESLLEELEKAEKFIFLEYFIVDEGLMWGNILDVLARKAAAGVEVRLLYDGTCEFQLLPVSYPKKLAELGIKCRVFAPVTPFVSTHYNFRDHRKILIIDGHSAYTGGVNLADEYINELPRFGHWKDAAVLIRGEAVRSFTLMFLQMWHMPDKSYSIEGYVNCHIPRPADAAGFVLPYGDSPVDDERAGHQVYLDILNRAERYVHIMTPYLILDAEMENALKYAAKRGVDVRLILPGIPDKRAPYALAKSHYSALVAAGVRIYEYTPGFVHSKVFVSDDRRAVVGTINLDYRSLSHHFECAAYMLDCPCIADIESDFRRTLEKCRRVSPESIKNESLFTKACGILLKVFAPLL